MFSKFANCVHALETASSRGVSLFCDMSDIAIWSDMTHFRTILEIFTLRYGNLYFAIWEYLLCDMILHEPKNEIFTLRYEKIYFAIWDTNDKTSKMYFTIWDAYRTLNIVYQIHSNIMAKPKMSTASTNSITQEI